MALIECPECRKQVSSEARACPFCGYPVAERVGATQAVGSASAPDAAPAGDSSGANGLLLEVRPSWWNYFWYWVFFWLVIPPIVAWVKRSSVVLRIFRERITVERGIFSKCYQDYRPRDIRAIDVDQSVLHRLVGIGDLTISTAATAEGSEIVRGVPDPKGIRDLILSQQQRSDD